MNGSVNDLTVTHLFKKGPRYFVQLSDGSQEQLNPETLDSNKQGRASCLVRRAKQVALFGDTARLELHKEFKTQSGFWGLVVNKFFYPVMNVDPKFIPIKSKRPSPKKPLIKIKPKPNTKKKVLTKKLSKKKPAIKKSSKQKSKKR